MHNWYLQGLTSFFLQHYHGNHLNTHFWFDSSSIEFWYVFSSHKAVETTAFWCFGWYYPPWHARTVPMHMLQRWIYEFETFTCQSKSQLKLIVLSAHSCTALFRRPFHATHCISTITTPNLFSTTWQLELWINVRAEYCRRFITCDFWTLVISEAVREPKMRHMLSPITVMNRL
jgi:hypothetical protein